MKHILPLSLALALPAFAGTPAAVAPAPAPAPAPTLTEWFVGASYGQFTGIEAISSTANFQANDLDLEMIALHAGRTFSCLGGGELSAYLEVAYLDGDFDTLNTAPVIAPISNNLEVDMLPVTLNLKYEHNLIGGLGAYVTAGAGYAWTQVKSRNGGSDHDGGFIAQASAGLVYNITDAFEVFGGARWLYLDECDFVGAPASQNDAFGWEAGLRYNF